MVHNGIEYGIMAAYAEGLNILRNANIGKRTGEVDAETTPLRNPEFYQYEMNLPEIAEVWRRGSVIGSWLLDLTASALLADPELANYGGRVSDSGEGRWTIQAAIEEAVPAHVLTAALYRTFLLAATPILRTGSCRRACGTSSAAMSKSPAKNRIECVAVPGCRTDDQINLHRVWSGNWLTHAKPITGPRPVLH